MGMPRPKTPGVGVETGLRQKVEVGVASSIIHRIAYTISLYKVVYKVKGPIFGAEGPVSSESVLRDA